MRALVAAVILLGSLAWADPVVLEGIEVRQGVGPRIVLRLSSEVAPSSHPLRAEGEMPDRIFVDLPNTLLSKRIRSPVAGVGDVLRVRTGQFDAATARVVLDLARPRGYVMRASAREIVIDLDPIPAVVASDAPAPSTDAKVEPSAVPPPIPAPAAGQPAASTLPAPLAEAPRPPVEPPPAPAREEVAAKPADEAPAAPAPPPVQAIPAPLPLGADPDTGIAFVVIDPGHGGRDPGAEGVGGAIEKDIVLRIAQRLATKLPERLPVVTFLTRASDQYIALADRLPPGDTRATLFLSLHANACPDPARAGIEVFYGGDSVRPAGLGAPGGRAALLGRLLTTALEQRVGTVRGPARAGPFRVLAQNPVPSALVEVGYLTHAGDAVRIQDPIFQDQLTDAMVAAVGDFLRATTPRF